MRDFFYNFKNDSEFKVSIIICFFIVIIIAAILYNGDSDNNYSYKGNTFNIIASSENEVFDSYIKDYARKKGYNVSIEYDDTLKITSRINSGEEFDGVWLSNSIWTYMIDTNKAYVTNSKSTSINPIVFGIKKSKAEELGFIDKEVYSKDILDAIKSGKLKFSMSNPTSTNSGASAYLGILSTLAGNPEVLTSKDLSNEKLKEDLRSFFSGVERTSGDEDYLEEMFVQGNYDAVFTYESSIININKKLGNSNKEILYAIYPVDGVSISDSPFAYIDNHEEYKLNIFNDLQSYLLSDKSQKKMADVGRRTWYGGVSDTQNKKVFNPDWGIDTTKYISPAKYPSTAVIKEALILYQTALRKPIHVAFCLDYSGSMFGTGNEELNDAMDYILTDRAANDLVQFSDEDIIDVLPFSDGVNDVWSTSEGLKTSEILNKVKNERPSGATALYPCATRALQLLEKTDTNKYNVSAVLMTDGQANVGYFSDLRNAYNKNEHKVPIYSIMFGASSETQLNEIAKLSNGKVFDGRDNLVEAFKTVRGYN